MYSGVNVGDVNRASRQITESPAVFEMTEGIHRGRSREVLVPAILVLYDAKNIQVLCWVFWHLLLLNFL